MNRYIDGVRRQGGALDMQPIEQWTAQSHALSPTILCNMDEKGESLCSTYNILYIKTLHDIVTYP